MAAILPQTLPVFDPHRLNLVAMMFVLQEIQPKPTIERTAMNTLPNCISYAYGTFNFDASQVLTDEADDSGIGNNDPLVADIKQHFKAFDTPDHYEALQERSEAHMLRTSARQKRAKHIARSL